MNKLAIKGHPTRGKEVIEILKMLGGINDSNIVDTCVDCYYRITINGGIYGEQMLTNYKETKVFTLEEFLEKYPFKVGDEILTKNGDTMHVVSMYWNNNEIRYDLSGKNLKGVNISVTEIDSIITNVNITDMETKVETTGFMQMGKTVAVIFNEANYEDEVELQLGDYEIEVRDGKTYAVKKKPKYPTTYEECCKVLGISYRAQLSYTYPEVEHNNAYLTKEKHLLDAFMKLRICRNAYWKIAVKGMDLDGSWEPKFGKTVLFDISFYFYQDNFVLHKGEYRSSDKCILVFSTKEMRDAFYENFKDLIEQCKELL